MGNGASDAEIIVRNQRPVPTGNGELNPVFRQESEYCFEDEGPPINESAVPVGAGDDTTNEVGYFAFSLAEAGAIFNPDELEYALEAGRPILIIDDPKAHLPFMCQRLPSLSFEKNADPRKVALALRDFSPQIFLHSERKHWIEKTARALRDGNCSELHIYPVDATLSPIEVYSEVEAVRYSAPLYEPPERSRAPLKAEPFQPLDWTTVARDEFVYGLHRQIGIVSGTIAEGGRGKSTLTLTEAVAIATGKDLLGRGAVRPQRVLYYNLEEGLLSLCKRRSRPFFQPTDLLRLILAAVSFFTQASRMTES